MDVPGRKIDHPNPQVIINILTKMTERRRYRDLKIEVVRFDKFNQIYIVGFSWKNFFETITLPVEMVDEAFSLKGPMPFSRIRFLLRNSLRELKDIAQDDSGGET